MVKQMIRILVYVAAFTSGTVYAAGDAAAGRELSDDCAACHGEGGLSTDAQFPILAGQVPGYISKQLADFKNGVRKSEIMSGMAEALSPQDMANLDAFFSSQPGVTGSINRADLPLALIGEKIFRGGREKLSVSPCMACHSPDGKGILPRFPRLAGQHAAYVEKQLLAYKAGNRTNDSMIMQKIAFRLSAKEIRALALYVQGLK